MYSPRYPAESAGPGQPRNPFAHPRAWEHISSCTWGKKAIENLARLLEISHQEVLRSPKRWIRASSLSSGEPTLGIEERLSEAQGSHHQGEAHVLLKRVDLFPSQSLRDQHASDCRALSVSASERAESQLVAMSQAALYEPCMNCSCKSQYKFWKRHGIAGSWSLGNPS